MNSSSIPGRPSGLFSTLRKDNWWIESLIVFLVFSGFIVYATFAGLSGTNYYSAPYLCPMYSPLLFVDPFATGGAPVEHALFGAFPTWWPSFIPASPAILIVGFPALFRFTCYYYRGAYYKAFPMLPAGCAVGGARTGKYKGETRLMIFQNLHRFALYFALIFVVVLTYDAVLAFSKNGKFGIGLGTIIMCINPILIGCYTFGCHSFRHLIGGGDDCFSCHSEIRKGAYKKVSWLNANHKKFAWASLLWVLFTDIYIRLCAMEVITDPNTWG